VSLNDSDVSLKYRKDSDECDSVDGSIPFQVFSENVGTGRGGGVTLNNFF
jgi:hypothetical protein